MVAVRYNHRKLVEFLLEKWADVNAKLDCGDTALMISAINGNTEIVKLLIEKGADVNAKKSFESCGTTCFERIRNVIKK